MSSNLMDRGQILQIHQRAGVVSRANIRREARCPLCFSLMLEFRIPLVIHLPHFHATAIILGCTFNLCFILNQAISRSFSPYSTSNPTDHIIFNDIHLFVFFFSVLCRLYYSLPISLILFRDCRRWIIKVDDVLKEWFSLTAVRLGIARMSTQEISMYTLLKYITQLSLCFA